MTDDSLSPTSDPSEFLATLVEATRQVRRAQRGTWFPLLAFAATMLVAIPIYRFAPRHLGPCRPGPQGTSVCTSVNPSVLVYWPIALVFAYALIAAYYVRRSRRRGVGTPVRPYVVVGVSIALLLAAASCWRAVHPPTPSLAVQLHLAAPGLSVYDLLTPAAAIGLALLVLAWVERNLTLAEYSICYLVIVEVMASQAIHSSSLWWFLPQLLIPAGLLLAGSAGFALFQPTATPEPR